MKHSNRVRPPTACAVVQALTPLSEQPEHQKVLAAGKPADAEPGNRHGLVRSMPCCG